RRCGLRKSKGIPLWSILSYIFSNVFRGRHRPRFWPGRK
ncbi:transposase, partial [Lactobacillus delbrueckii]|nr:transposase [Lactobacillus delbrueckii]